MTASKLPEHPSEMLPMQSSTTPAKSAIVWLSVRGKLTRQLLTSTRQNCIVFARGGLASNKAGGGIQSSGSVPQPMA